MSRSVQPRCQLTNPMTHGLVISQQAQGGQPRLGLGSQGCAFLSAQAQICLCAAMFLHGQLPHGLGSLPLQGQPGCVGSGPSPPPNAKATPGTAWGGGRQGLQDQIL